MPIGLFDTATSMVALQEQIRDRIDRRLERGVYILGPEVEAFEQEFAEYLGVTHAIGVGNGTDAITIGLSALGVGRGRRGGRPGLHLLRVGRGDRQCRRAPGVLRCRPATAQPDPETVRAVLTPRTKAVVSVDLFGLPHRSPALRALGVPVLEDAAQAAGASLDGRARRLARRRWRRSRSIPPRISARSATAARSPPTTIRPPSSRGRCASTARATSRRSSTWATTRGLTNSRRRFCASCCRSSTAGATDAGRPLGRTARRVSTGT